MKTHAFAQGRRRRDGLSHNQERARCGRTITRTLGVRSGPELAQPGETPTCRRCASEGPR